MSLWSSLKEQYYFSRQYRKFRKCHGYELDLENPRSYNEKVVWRKIFDRNPLFPILADKYRSREYVVERLGKEAGEKILVPLLFVTEDPEEIPFDDLPEEYIIKPNHGSGWSIIVDRDHKVPRKKIISKCRKWMKKTYGQSKMEWAYSQVRPMIMVEELLKDSNGVLPTDFKFEVLNGKVANVYLLHDRFGTPSEANYDRNFRRRQGSDYHVEAPETAKPQEFEEMVAIAEKLASEVDCLRVDLYNVEGRVFFGELTLYSASGLYRYDPPDFDFMLGDLWRLDRSHARSFCNWSQSCFDHAL